MLNELGLRTHEFTEGHRVRLADGQEWNFPRPRLRFFPARDSGGKFALSGENTFDNEYRQLITAYAEADRSDAYLVWTLKIQIACHLLLANYSLADAELAELLPVEFEDDANMAMWRELSPVLLAMPPKPSTDGVSTP